VEDGHGCVLGALSDERVDRGLAERFESDAEWLLCSAAAV
jgi:hypothetical protein